MDIDDQYSVRSMDQSVYSYNSTRDSHLHRQLQGRIFNAKNELYLLPADETEWSRLDKQHVMLLLGLGGLYAPHELVNRRLQYEPGVQKSILDLGTGGGNWAISMAQEFPHVNVVGVDLAPSTTRPPPPNCRFEFDDFSLGLSHYHGQFDVVHARSTANGLKCYEKFVDECGRCLRPGGVLLLAEGDFQLCDENKGAQPIPYEGDGSGRQCWFQRMIFEAYHVMKSRGSSMDAGKMFHHYVQRSNLFENVGYRNVWCPVGPWKTDPDVEQNSKLSSIGTLMRQNTREFIRAIKPLLISTGYPTELVDIWISRTDEQLVAQCPRVYTKWHYVWGTLRAGELPEPVELLPQPPSAFETQWPLPDLPSDVQLPGESDTLGRMAF